MIRPWVTAVLLLASCGAPGPVAQTSTGVATDLPESPGAREPKVVAREAPVPPASDPHEVLVFVREGSVWMMKSDGTDAVQLTVRSHDAADESPALSPDGTRIAYSSPADGSYRIYVMSLEELVPTPLTSGDEGGDNNPCWSPDGKQIAFTRGDPRDKRDLYVVAADGKSPPVLLLEGNDDEPDYGGTPAWSPDGKTIVIAADRREARGTRLWAVDVATRAVHPITPVRQSGWFVSDEDPAWSPDGKTIAFASNRHAQSGDQQRDLDIYSIHPDGSGLTRLTDDPGAAADPAYSPDGKRLYFASNRLAKQGYEREIYVMAAGGGKQRRLTRDERPQNSAPQAGRRK